VDSKEKKNMKRKLYRKLLSEDLFQASYVEVSKGFGANTPGTEESQPLDGYSKEIVRSTIEDLKTHRFKFKPIRRVYIPKSNGGKRPLGIPSPRDKVVQKCMSVLLEEIYENGEFLNCSHGFRKNKGTHTALKEISTWTGTK